MAGHDVRIRNLPRRSDKRILALKRLGTIVIAGLDYASTSMAIAWVQGCFSLDV
ncbi:TPA: hypothetical protein HA338_07080 [Methanosarcina acetivorans]|uniref:Uncharacterized protein n=1 Tax=Methanosarcina acetivorans TaxID=2214 RepID=A0A832S979_9EURY|nr:hypothetical protein [Methanosarcina acetivorans]HIH93803.1 hypothetical protein [Methanosarcina acetivorans]